MVLSLPHMPLQKVLLFQVRIGLQGGHQGCYRIFRVWGKELARSGVMIDIVDYHIWGNSLLQMVDLKIL